MSVIVGGNKIIVHSYIPPIVFDSIQEPGKRYVIADGKWTEIPNHLVSTLNKLKLTTDGNKR